MAKLPKTVKACNNEISRFKKKIKAMEKRKVMLKKKPAKKKKKVVRKKKR